MACDNEVWTLKADEEIMSWAVSQPQDWQLGSKCKAYLWGNGRHGQLAEIGQYFKTVFGNLFNTNL